MLQRQFIVKASTPLQGVKDFCCSSSNRENAPADFFVPRTIFMAPAQFVEDDGNRSQALRSSATLSEGEERMVGGT